MSLTANQIKKLEQIIQHAMEILQLANASGKAVSTPRKRRSGKELVAFRKMLKQEVAAGASVVDVAKKHGVTTAYIYQLPGLKRAKSAAKKTAGGKAAAKVAPRKAASKKTVARKSAAKKSRAKRASIKGQAQETEAAIPANGSGASV